MKLWGKFINSRTGDCKEGNAQIDISNEEIERQMKEQKLGYYIVPEKGRVEIECSCGATSSDNCPIHKAPTTSAKLTECVEPKPNKPKSEYGCHLVWLDTPKRWAWFCDKCREYITLDTGCSNPFCPEKIKDEPKSKLEGTCICGEKRFDGSIKEINGVIHRKYAPCYIKESNPKPKECEHEWEASNGSSYANNIYYHYICSKCGMKRTTVEKITPKPKEYCKCLRDWKPGYMI